MPTQIMRHRLERLLFDDAPYGDLTTDLLGIAAEPGLMTFTARREMVLALSAEAATLLKLAGADVERLRRDGEALPAGAEILRARGPAGALLRGWKVAQTLVEIWSGVATAAREIVESAAPRRPTSASPARGKTRPASRISQPRPSAPAAP